ncbi:MAG: glycosyltransferase family 1 protein [Burkholderiales bacterium]
MRLLIDDRWIGPHGIGRFAREVIARLPPGLSMPYGLGPSSPVDPVWTALQLARFAPDVYFEPGYNPPLAGRTPFVFTLHDLIHLQVPEEASTAKRLYYERIVRPAVRRAYRVFTVSEFSKREIVAWSGAAPAQVEVVGNGVSAGFTADGPRFALDRPYFLYVGNRRPHKNVRRLLAAFAASGCAGEVALMLSGAPDVDAAAWVRAAGLDDVAVRFAGPIAEARLPDYYRGAMALVIPSLYEGFGLPALEAMACGTPVLASDRSSLPEVVGEAGVLVDPEDTRAIGAALKHLAQDETLRADLAARGRTRAACFEWDTTARRVFVALESAARTRRSR